MQNGLLKSPAMRCLLLALLIATASSVAGNAASISGTVTDKVTGQPLFGATIKVEPVMGGVDAKGSKASADGHFDVSDLTEGRFYVTVSFVGYATEKIAISINRDSGAKSYDFALTPRVLYLDGVSVSASRREEKILEAPAAVSVLDAESVAERTTLTVTEHIKGLPAVDVATTGLNQSNAVIRGFNNIFSGTMLVLTDNRLARVPSLRFNAHNFIPVANDDIERIEVVSGPGSALYGPNAASGVMHIITKSPFSSRGTNFTVGGGERDLHMASFRHAGAINNRLGYKITGQYYQGDDWQHSEPAEPSVVQKYRLGSAGAVPVGQPTFNDRDFDIERLAGEARIDYIINDDASVIVNGGFNRANSIELTGLGAAQAIEWTYSYFQSRLKYKDLFLQGFVNASNAGDTYLLQSGQLIIDKSKLWAAQAQHRYSPVDRLSLTYGLDALFTRPNTEETINGRNEELDNINELGAYLQADARLTETVKLLGAIRVDDHNKLNDLIFSPRAGIVYQPYADHNFRVTYNRAFSTPDNNTLYLDLLTAPNPFGTGVDIRAQGVPETGFHWGIDEHGVRFRSPFAPLAGEETSHYFDLDDPTFTQDVWDIGSGLVMDTLSAHLAGAVMMGALTQAQADGIEGLVDFLAPDDVSNIGNIMRTFNPDTRSFDNVTADDIADIDRMKPTITQTVEFGYKGVIGNRLNFTADLYWTKKNDFIGPLTIESPNVFLSDADLAVFLGTEIGPAYNGLTLDQQGALVFALDNPDFGGNGNGTALDELVTMFTTGGTSIALGTVSPEEMFDPTAVLVTYRNFGDISFYGADFSLGYHLHRNFDVGGTYSYISKNFFPKDNDQVHDINLNSPRHKFGLHARYNNQHWGLTTQSRLRFVDAFDMDSPFFGTSVESYTVVDLNVALNVAPGTALSITVQNMFDNRHVEFIGAPEIGRLTIARITYSL
ncbi:MAG: TonB-dependent receptor [candidate division Zixibacteria bacterium]